MAGGCRDEATGGSRGQIRQVRGEGFRFYPRCSGNPLKEFTWESEASEDELIIQAWDEGTVRALRTQGTRCGGLSGRAVREGFLEEEGLWLYSRQS